MTGTLKEFINRKLNRKENLGIKDATLASNDILKKFKYYFFSVNEVTLEKIKYIYNKLRIIYPYLKQFLSLGGNCADIFILGNNRIKGPLDNMEATKGLLSIANCLKTGLNYNFFEKGEISEPFNKYAKQICFTTENFFIMHNNFRDEKYRKDLKNRIDIFEKCLKNKNIQLLYFINRYDIDAVTNKMSQNFKSGFNYLKENFKDIFDRLIFVELYLEDNNWFKINTDDINNYTKKFIKIKKDKTNLAEEYFDFLDHFEKL